MFILLPAYLEIFQLAITFYFPTQAKDTIAKFKRSKSKSSKLGKITARND